MKVGRFSIGSQHPVFIVAEVGVNHNGDMGRAMEMIHIAKQAGADCVKFQTFSAERLVRANAPKAMYQLRNTSEDESQIDMLRNLELSESDHERLYSCCTDADVLFLSTPYNFADVDFLHELGVEAFKLASMHAAEPCFVRYTAEKQKPVFLSTGMATLSEVDESVRAIHAAGNSRFVLLQGTTNYPSKVEDANLGVLKTLQTAFSAPVGYSDHTQSDISSIAAVALGVCFIEKHFTLDRTLPGPDHASSATPDELRGLVTRIREAEASIGSSSKEPSALEQTNSIVMRRSIVAALDIQAGTAITESHLELKRPADGMKPSEWQGLLGKKARVAIRKDTSLRPDMFEYE